VRTTLTLDEDVAAKLKAEVRRTGRSFKEIVNGLLRGAMSARPSPPRSPPFRVDARPLGLKPGMTYDHVSELLEQLEGARHA
jgi:hypothetical protein